MDQVRSNQADTKQLEDAARRQLEDLRYKTKGGIGEVVGLPGAALSAGFDQALLVDTTEADVTVQVPEPVAEDMRKPIILKNYSDGTHKLTAICPEGTLIDGQPTYEAKPVVSGQIGWQILWIMAVAPKRYMTLFAEGGCPSCTNSCSGVCSGSCAATTTGSCSACTGSCASTCGNSCTAACGDSCHGSCDSACTSACGGSCTATCGGSCTTSCGEACHGGCSGSCAGTATGSCGDCTGSCAGACTGGCSASCTTSCTGSCEGSCIGDCTGSCATSCAGGVEG